jgi:hypothetical protein
LKYGILLWPHANARYHAEAVGLARAELEVMLGRIAPDAALCGDSGGKLGLLAFETSAPLSAAEIQKLSRHSLLYALFQIEGDLLRPASGRAETYLLPDLPGVLKYKGKTNELFTLLTMNLAVYASAFANEAETRLRFADPMCSRGTSLFQAVNRGWDAYGCDISSADLRELTQYFKRYLEYHKIKHAHERESFTVQGAKPAPAFSFAFAESADEYRAGNKHILRGAECDCALINRLFGKPRYHVMAADLPYGVQHAPGGGSLEKLLARSMPGWRDALLPGGALALSFNTNIIKRETIRSIMEGGGLTAMRQGPWDGFAHWVEQAVDRDVAVGVRPGRL